MTRYRAGQSMTFDTPSSYSLEGLKNMINNRAAEFPESVGGEAHAAARAALEAAYESLDLNDIPAVQSAIAAYYFATEPGDRPGFDEWMDS